MSAEPKEVERSVRDELIAARDQIASRETETPEVPARAEKPERIRDEAGRFASTQETPEIPAEPAAEAMSGHPPSGQEQPVAAPALPPAPEAWSHTAKAKWAALDPDLRSEIIKREADVHKGITNRDAESAFGKEMQKVLQPYEAILRAEGVAPAQAIQSVLNTAYILRTADPISKARAIAQVCQQYGVDLSLLAQPQQDPATASLHQKVAQLETQLRTQRESAQQALLSEVNSAIDSFSQDPKHPHFNAVRAHMGALMQAGEAKDLEQAYEMAIWARPDLRSQLLTEQTAQQKAAEEARKKAERARVKGSSLRGGPGGYAPPQPKSNGSVREDLEAALEEHRGRI